MGEEKWGKGVGEEKWWKGVGEEKWEKGEKGKCKKIKCEGSRYTLVLLRDHLPTAIQHGR